MGRTPWNANTGIHKLALTLIEAITIWPIIFIFSVLYVYIQLINIQKPLGQSPSKGKHCDNVNLLRHLAMLLCVKSQ